MPRLKVKTYAGVSGGGVHHTGQSHAGGFQLFRSGKDDSLNHSRSFIESVVTVPKCYHEISVKTIVLLNYSLQTLVFFLS